MPALAARILTDKLVRGLKGKPRDIADGGCKGLSVRLSGDGTKSWRVTYSVNGNRQRKTIGQFPTMGLSDARKRRDEIMRAHDRGHDPFATAPQHAFSVVADDFLSLHVARKSKKPSDATRI